MEEILGMELTFCYENQGTANYQVGLQKQATPSLQH